MAAQLQTALTILRRKQVEQRTGLARSTIYSKMKRDPKRPRDYDATFPLPITLGNGAKAVGWIESEVEAWLAAQVEASRNGAAANASKTGCENTGASVHAVPTQRERIAKSRKTTATDKG